MSMLTSGAMYVIWLNNAMYVHHISHSLSCETFPYTLEQVSGSIIISSIMPLGRIFCVPCGNTYAAPPLLLSLVF